MWPGASSSTGASAGGAGSGAAAGGGCAAAFFSQSRQSWRPSETGNPQAEHFRRLATGPRPAGASGGAVGALAAAMLSAFAGSGEKGASFAVLLIDVGAG